jgi:hypothetical protein
MPTGTSGIGDIKQPLFKITLYFGLSGRSCIIFWGPTGPCDLRDSLYLYMGQQPNTQSPLIGFRTKRTAELGMDHPLLTEARFIIRQTRPEPRVTKLLRVAKAYMPNDVVIRDELASYTLKLGYRSGSIK